MAACTAGVAATADALSVTTGTQAGAALVIGASGGIGAALFEALNAGGVHAPVIAASRRGVPGVDLLDEASVARLASAVAETAVPLRLVIMATGALDREGCLAEKSLKQLSADAMLRSFALNSVGPALVLKHLLPLIPGEGRCVVAALSARVGSIGDNRLGGWYSYRASKAALNQLIHTAAIEVRRRSSGAICVALHPGTVDTRLGDGYARRGLEVQSPALAAARLLSVIDALTPADSGGFFDHHGLSISW